jgi:hypothetical protein
MPALISRQPIKRTNRLKDDALYIRCCAMSEAEFIERMAQIRARFARKLANEVEEMSLNFGRLAGASREAVEATAAAYLTFHEMCGIGPTIGFEATGQAARAVDGILILAYRAQRGLTDDELSRLKGELEHVRAAMRAEIKPEELAS